jgi:hypothetical protein
VPYIEHRSDSEVLGRLPHNNEIQGTLQAPDLNADMRPKTARRAAFDEPAVFQIKQAQVQGNQEGVEHGAGIPEASKGRLQGALDPINKARYSAQGYWSGNSASRISAVRPCHMPQPTPSLLSRIFGL